MKILLINKKTSLVEGITYLESLEDVPKDMDSLEIEENDNYDYMYRKYNLETKKISKEKYEPNIPIVEKEETLLDLKKQLEILTQKIEELSNK